MSQVPSTLSVELTPAQFAAVGFLLQTGQIPIIDGQGQGWLLNEANEKFLATRDQHIAEYGEAALVEATEAEVELHNHHNIKETA